MALVKTCKLFTVLNSLNVEVVSYNKNYFNSERDLINIHSLLLSNLVESDFEDIIDFFKDSVENDYYLNDFLKEIDFKVKGEEIIFKEENEEYSYKNMGEYTVGNYKVSISGSYSFIEDLYDSNRKFMYYGD